MSLLGTLKDVAIDSFGDLLSGFFSVSQMKKYIGSVLGEKLGEKTAEAGETTEATNGPKLKHGGFMNLSDTAIYLDLCGRLMDKIGRNEPRALAKIATFQKKHLDADQNERFRVALGILYAKDEVKRIKYRHEIPRAGDAPEIKETFTETRHNPAVRFLIEFSRLTNNQKLDVLDSAGILKGDFERKLEKFKKWAEENKDDILSGLDKMNKMIAGENIEMSYWGHVFNFWPFNSPKRRWIGIMLYVGLFILLAYGIATVGR